MNYTEIIEEAVARSGVDDIAIRNDGMLKILEKDLSQKLRGVSHTYTMATIESDSNGDFNLPSDFNGFVSLWDSRNKLRLTTVDSVKYNSNNSIYMYGSGLKSNLVNKSLELHYYASIPPLKKNNENWLSRSDPEIYIHGLIFQGFIFKSTKEKDPNELQILSAKIPAQRSYFDELIEVFRENDISNQFSKMPVYLNSNLTGNL